MSAVKYWPLPKFTSWALLPVQAGWFPKDVKKLYPVLASVSPKISQVVPPSIENSKTAPSVLVSVSHHTFTLTCGLTRELKSNSGLVTADTSLSA